MASQSPFFSSPLPIINKKAHSFSAKPNNYNCFTFKNSKIPSSKTEPSPNPQEPENEKQKLAFAKESFIERLEALKSGNQPNDASDDTEAPSPPNLAMERAKEYRKNKGVVGSEGTSGANVFLELDKGNGGLKSDEGVKNGGGEKDVSFALRLAMEKAKLSENGTGVVDISETAGLGFVGGNGRSLAEKKPANSAGTFEELLISSRTVQDSSIKDEVDDKNAAVNSDEVVKNNAVQKEVPLALKLAMEKAKEYKKDKGVVGKSGASASGLAGQNGKSLQENKPVQSAGKSLQENKPVQSAGKSTISSIDFVGLNFSDKKTGRGLPPGLLPVQDPYYMEGDYPEVEILVGDASKFGKVASSSNPTAPTEDDTELYKPKVTTWGVFPRPNDISKAYGGGRTLRPGEALETAEEKAAKQEKTRKMVAAYRAKTGQIIDPKLKAEGEKILAEGDELMDRGKLKAAIPFYEEVMEKLVYETELHGLAALQWSICLDSLSRSNEARAMYERLQSHPSPKVNKKAKQFFASFEAMEFLKVTKSSPVDPFTGYQTYFDAFVREKTSIPLQDDEGDEATLSQAIPYVFFLMAPILMVLFIATFRSR